MVPRFIFLFHFFFFFVVPNSESFYERYSRESFQLDLTGFNCWVARFFFSLKLLTSTTASDTFSSCIILLLLSLYYSLQEIRIRSFNNRLIALVLVIHIMLLILYGNLYVLIIDSPKKNVSPNRFCSHIFVFEQPIGVCNTILNYHNNTVHAEFSVMTTLCNAVSSYCCNNIVRRKNIKGRIFVVILIEKICAHVSLFARIRGV